MKIYCMLISLVFAFTLVTACVAVESDSQSEVNTTTPLTVTTGEILENALEYDAKLIEVTGKITSQCGSGCWFIISDESGDLYVNLKPNNFVIPPAMGKEVTVTGVLKVKDNDASLIGSSVLLGGKTYP
ncbi:MAG: hypothetical protein LUQ50_09720 [Methanospirillum sp.]|uniref:hypothetical protein n=1 Tax=Methanospirillum sp. TaxID=45200 RepID=UPI00236D983B|nr:hypothetical protein [Methanospirillum sp.]MDD1729333.1 hypothetical protein [Methanospirillum sp.]